MQNEAIYAVNPENVVVRVSRSLLAAAQFVAQQKCVTGWSVVTAVLPLKKGEIAADIQEVLWKW